MTILKLGAFIVAAILPVFTGQANAESAAEAYPNAPIRLIVPWPPGGGSDNLMRVLSPKLSDALGQSVVIENRPGAAGNIGAAAGARAPADGYTLIAAYSGTHVINPAVYENVGFRETDFDPVILIASVPMMVVVNSELPVHTMKDLVKLEKQSGSKMFYGSSGTGTLTHLAAEMFNQVAGTHFKHIPYKGGSQSVIDLLAGRIDVIFADPASVIAHIRSGKLRPLAITSMQRAQIMPDLVTIAESGYPNYDVRSWNGILVPAGTPQAIVQRLNSEMDKIIHDPAMMVKLKDGGYEVVGGSPESFGKYIRVEIDKWAPVVKAANITVN